MAPPSLGSSARLNATVAAAYALLVICMWAWYGLHSGMGYETGFVVDSEVRGWWRGFFYPGDAMRPYTSVFYHVSYLIGASLGQAGSYVPYQLVYAALWFLRGLLVYAIVRALGDRRGAVAFLAGAFTILHAADVSLNWVGQLNQFGFIFWMLLGFYFLLLAFEQQHRILLAATLAFVATNCARLCLYSYESPLPLIFAFPLLVIVLFGGWSWRKVLLVAIFYSLPLRYCWKWLRAYLSRSAEESYQFSVLRKDWGAASIVNDWMVDIWRSLAFWQWPNHAETAHHLPLVVAAFAALAAAVTLAVHSWVRRGAAAVPEPATRRFAWRLMALGFAMVVASFPVYLLLDSAASHWRTQLLPGPGTGIVFAALLTIVGEVRVPAWLSGRLQPLIASAICVAGVWAGQGQALTHRLIWERHRDIMAAVLTTVPRVADGTVFVLVNHRAEPPVFGHSLWWNNGLRLAYPGRAVAGVYYDAPGKPAPGTDIVYGQRVKVGSRHTVMAVEDAGMRNLLVLALLPDGRMAVAEKLPAWLGIDARFQAEYRPHALIDSWPPDERAMRRYAPSPPH